MGILDSVERGLERAVNGAFARTFRSGVQPVEISSALKKELDIGAVVVDRDRVLAPNRFVVRVSEKDANRLQSMGATLENELRGIVLKHAARQNYQLLGEPDVEIRTDPSLTPGVVEVDASQVEGSVAWVPVVEVDGARHELTRGTTTVGRGSDCGIRISDSAASRKHLEFIWDGQAGIVRDLGSTNGSKINGQRFREAALTPDIVIMIGKTSLRFRLAPGRDQAGRSSSQARTAAIPGTNSAAHQQAAPQPASRQPAPRKSTQAQSQAQSQAPSPAPQRLSDSPPQAHPSDAPGIDQDFWRGL